MNAEKEGGIAYHDANNNPHTINERRWSPRTEQEGVCAHHDAAASPLLELRLQRQRDCAKKSDSVPR
jgi:hypothetical protein